MKSNLKAFSIFFLIFYLVWVFRATIFFGAVDKTIADDTLRLVFGNIIKFILWVIPAAVFVFRVDKQNPLDALKVTTEPDRGGLISATMVTLLYFIIVFVAEKYLISGRTLASLLQASPLLLLSTLAQVFFSPISEELLFRGFVLPKLNKRFSFWQANVIQSLLFTAMHLPNWIWVNGPQLWLITMSISVFIIAMLFGWILRRTNSIWPPIVVHIVNNFLVSFLG